MNTINNPVMKTSFVLILTFLAGITLLAQQTVSTSGGNAAAGVGGTVSYTVGQLTYTTINDLSSGSMAQGIQQPYEISVITGAGDVGNIYLEMSVYPNPATDFLILKIAGEEETQYFASLYNINGNLIKTIKIETNETTIPMQGYSTGTYFLKMSIITSNMGLPKNIKTFKIIKH
jgi:hypothetical protein